MKRFYVQIGQIVSVEGVSEIRLFNQTRRVAVGNAPRVFLWWLVEGFLETGQVAINCWRCCGVLCCDWIGSFLDLATLFRGALVSFFASDSFVEWRARDAT
jgi:hypothetical protein